MKTRKGLTGILASVAMIAGLSGKVTYSDVVIKTELPQADLVADGTTVYQLNIRADTTQHSGVKFNSAEWDVSQVNPYINVLSATLPDGTNNTSGPSANTEDFFYNFLMDASFNRATTTLSGTDLTNNVRITNSPSDGPSDKTFSNGLLGKYTFTVNQNAPLGQNNFGLFNVTFTDTDFNVYYSPDINNGVTVQNDTYNITSPVVCDVPALTPLGGLALAGLMIGAGAYSIRKGLEERRDYSKK